jgi:hypothetical protein
VDEADIYLGVFAHRYGYVPKGYDISVTEMEYNHAVERKIPRLIFLMHEDHPVKAADVEKSEGASWEMFPRSGQLPFFGVNAGSARRHRGIISVVTEVFADVCGSECDAI